MNASGFESGCLKGDHEMQKKKNKSMRVISF